jgi:hypothetical protein
MGSLLLFFLTISGLVAAIPCDCSCGNPPTSVTTLPDIPSPVVNNTTDVTTNTTIPTVPNPSTTTTADPVTTTPVYEHYTPIRLTVSNECGEPIWPGILTQGGIGPGTGGFELQPGDQKVMFVSDDWAGRVWGRTNCSFNHDGTGPNTQFGVNGYGGSCLTGDCNGRLDCQVAVSFDMPPLCVTVYGTHKLTLYLGRSPNHPRRVQPPRRQTPQPDVL